MKKDEPKLPISDDKQPNSTGNEEVKSEQVEEKVEETDPIVDAPEESKGTYPVTYDTAIGNKVIRTPKSLSPIGHMTDVVAIATDLGFPSPYEYLKMMVESSSNTITRPGDALILYQKSRELNVGWTIALENIYMIPTTGGTKTALSVHLAKAMLQTRSNVKWIQTKDFAPVYTYVAKIGNEKILVTDLNELSSEYILYETTTAFKNHDYSLDAIPVTYLSTGGKRAIKTYVSEYKFTRKRIIDGEVITDTVVSSFSLQEAMDAGLVKEKGNYYKYPKLMLDHRSFMNGARKIASDILLGMYAPAELDGVEGVTILMDENGNPIKTV